MTHSSHCDCGRCMDAAKRLAYEGGPSVTELKETVIYDALIEYFESEGYVGSAHKWAIEKMRDLMLKGTR